MTTALQIEYEARRGVWSDIVDHLPALYEAASRPKGGNVVELGVRWGTSTAAFLAGADAAGGHVWSVDIAAPTYPSWWLDTGRWTLLIGNDLEPAVAAKLPDDIDVLFIDTSHAYDQTLAELTLYVPRVKPGGLVLLHDTELEAPAMVGPQPPFPVAKALDAYCAEQGLAWTNTPGCSGLGAIQIPLAALTPEAPKQTLIAQIAVTADMEVTPGSSS